MKLLDGFYRNTSVEKKGVTIIFSAGDKSMKQEVFLSLTEIESYSFFEYFWGDGSATLVMLLTFE